MKPTKRLASEVTECGINPRVIDALRSATGERHRRIEALLQLDSDFDRQRYIRILQGFAAFLALWEPLITARLPARLGSWFAERTRASVAQQDLLFLSAPNPRIGRVSSLETALPSLAATFGSMYVMEGSALGGQVISRQLARQHGINAENGGAYFAGNGPRTAARWRSFVQLLEHEVGPEQVYRDQACTAAVQTFDALFDACHTAISALSPG